LNEAGLVNKPYVSTLAVESPFNYTTQGQLIAETTADPKNADAYTREMARTDSRPGVVRWRCSRVQMKAAVVALGLANRRAGAGNARAAAPVGHPPGAGGGGFYDSFFGLQSFKGWTHQSCVRPCSSLLFFSPPSDPVEEARSEWAQERRRTRSRAGGVRHGHRAAAVDRVSFRTEDHATVICYDWSPPRLVFGGDAAKAGRPMP
jgi:ATP-dependent DNA helicase DinG